MLRNKQRKEGVRPQISYWSVVDQVGDCDWPQVWSMRRMLRHKQQKEGVQPQSRATASEPTLVLPQLAKLDTKAYAPSRSSEFFLLFVYLLVV